MDRFTTYDFLITFHCNHGPISYRFRDIRQFQSKIAKFFNPFYFPFPLKEFGTGAGSQQEAQLMLTTSAMHLEVSRGQQTWYRFWSVATFR